MAEVSLEHTDITAEVDRCVDETSIVRTGRPKLVLVLGGVASGKTRFRRDRYAKGHVALDAGDIFIHLSRGRYIAFPSLLEEPMNMIGHLVAMQAVRERRRIVCELVGAEVEPMKRLIDSYQTIDYSVSLEAMTVDIGRAIGWNLSRSDTNISAYYTEPYHQRWLLAALEQPK
jgi:hypothetical protein